MMIARSLLLCCSLTLVAAADDAQALFEEAERLSRSNQKMEAMDKVQEAVAAIDRAVAAGEKLSWQTCSGLRFAARLARDDFLDYERSLSFCNRLFELTDTDYWRVPARLERAMTYRAMKDFQKAEQQYQAVIAADPRYHASMLLPRAEMVLLDMAQRDQGRSLLEDALRCEAVNGRERFSSLRNCAQRALAMGRRDEALRWYAILEEMPFQQPEERARYLSQAAFEMGKIEESRRRTDEAKTLYRRAIELDDGEMRYRAKARDALEDIEYFE